MEHPIHYKFTERYIPPPSHQELLAATHRMADATAAWMPCHCGLELARNVASAIDGGVDPYHAALDGIEHRITHGWLKCALPRELALHMARAWRDEK